MPRAFKASNRCAIRFPGGGRKWVWGKTKREAEDKAIEEEPTRSWAGREREDRNARQLQRFELHCSTKRGCYHVPTKVLPHLLPHGHF